ncbi:MAG TPA: c-type cytochrome [Bryobacteraceae bacterium]|nr:c-type cytochrome [Bryobacteraceae bacterium]
MKFGHLVALGLALLAAHSSYAQDIAAALARVPPKARTKPNPLEAKPSASQAGKKLFEQHCAECHGSSAEGSRHAPALRDPQVREAAPGELFWILTNGAIGRGMPAWSKLPEPQRWQIITYLQSF